MSMYHPRLQSFGALLVLDADCRRIQASSSNLTRLTGIERPVKGVFTLADALGKRLSLRVRRELRGRQRLPDPLVFIRAKHGHVRFQIHAYRAGERVIAEIEPLNPSGKRRLLGTVNERLMHLVEATHQQELLDCLVNAIQQLTGYDRVTVCHFDSDWHGLMVAEALGKRLPSLLGQRFPASDFPVALRNSYQYYSARLIEDVNAPPETLIPAVPGAKLNGSFLRAPAPERQRYLNRLGVRGSFSLAIQGDTGLWGLVYCHSPAPHLVEPPVRDAVHTLVQMATQRMLLLRARQEARYLQRVQDSLVLSARARSEPQSPQQLLHEQAASWMKLFRAHGVVLWVKGGAYQAGVTPSPEATSQFVLRLERAHVHSGPWFTRDIANEPLTISLAMPEHSGVLAVPLPMSSTQRAWLIFFRPEQVETLYWAMPPTSHHKAAVRLAPSAAWSEEVVGKSEAWLRVERLAAVDLGEDLTLAISAYEISSLNMHLEHERKALAEANQRLEQLAHFDPLTKVWNRYRIEEAINAELVAAKRYAAEFALLLFDVDNFKQINDAHGHSVGDEVLVALARLVESSLRGCDHLGRWGGEEFIVLATHSDLDAALGLAERLRSLVTELHIEGLEQTVTVSIGVAVWQPGDSCKTIISRADDAMYRAKHGGRNRVEMAPEPAELM